MLEAKDQGHKRKCSQKKRSSKIFFRRFPVKNVFQNFFLGNLQNFNNSKSTKFQQCCSQAEDRASFENLGPRDQGEGLDLRGQGQGLQNVSSRPRTSSRTPPLKVSVYKAQQFLSSALY